ncbi:MAG: SAM-dependent methyltransferase, partial [Thermotogota bacterium]
IDIYTPWFWIYASGQSMEFNNAKRIYGYDFFNNRMIDRWISKDDENDFVIQSLRCYSPADLKLLIKNTSLKLEEGIPGSSFNYETKEFTPKADLNKSMMFTAILAYKS